MAETRRLLLLDRGCFRSSVNIDEEQALNIISRNEINSTFFGYVVYGSVLSKNGYSGVWGTRNASRFRNLLRTRGAALCISIPLHQPGF